MNNQSAGRRAGLYHPQFEHDNCGIGAVVNIKGIKSHDTVANALKIVENLEHRAGKDAEGKTGDGVGILLQISHRFFSKVCTPLGFSLPGERDYGVGMFFFPQDELKRNQAKKIFEVIVAKEGLRFLGWREVPIHPEVLGKKAVECMPCIMQAFIERPRKAEQGLPFDRRLYVARRIFEQSSDNTYVVSLSSRTIVYKGMFLVGQLRLFFEDLQDQDYESAIAMVHSRFSTNTNPSWERAHPNRFMVHNGEINTILGNADKMRAREETMSSEYLKGELHKVLPAINTSGSDSAMLDNALEFMVMSGMELPLAVMISIPEPWENNRSMSQDKKDFYHYYATMMEPWDGPASILFSDGDCMGAVLDRNGLRPSRYYITDDDQLILSSEVGVLDIDPTKIVVKERIHPGKMLLVDTIAGKVIDDEELKARYANEEPYGEWLDSNLIHLKDLKIPNQQVPVFSREECTRLQKAFGYTYEDVKTSILNMAKTGAEGISAMGIDMPLAVLSQKNQPLFGYFKQRFAQVTNPPIDAIREEVVTSTTIYVGRDGNLLEKKEENCKMLEVPTYRYAIDFALCSRKKILLQHREICWGKPGQSVFSFSINPKELLINTYYHLNSNMGSCSVGTENDSFVTTFPGISFTYRYPYSRLNGENDKGTSFLTELPCILSIIILKCRLSVYRNKDSRLHSGTSQFSSRRDGYSSELRIPNTRGCVGGQDLLPKKTEYFGCFKASSIFLRNSLFADSNPTKNIASLK